MPTSRPTNTKGNANGQSRSCRLKANRTSARYFILLISSLSDAPAGVALRKSGAVDDYEVMTRDSYTR